MAGTEQIIQRELDDPRVVFVFPHEESAAFWLKKALQLSPRRTIPTHRFIAWDEFKRQTLRDPARRKAADLPFRTLFLAGLLQENQRSGVFRRLIPPDHRSNSIAFLRWLREILPRLNRVQEIEPEALEEEKRADLLELLRRYREHLARCRRFEPAFELPPFQPGPQRFVVLYQEIVEDLHSRSPLFTSHPSVRIEPTDFSLAPLLPVLHVYDTTPEELTAALLEVGDLLSAGVPPEEIVLTVPCLEEVEPTLRILGERYEVPLSIHLKKPVSRYPVGRIFRAIGELVDSGFSLETLKALLLNRALPWREDRPIRGLLQFGVENRIFRNYSLRGESLDLWEAGLKRALARDGREHWRKLLDFYRDLKRETERIVRAPGFRELKDRLEAFTDGVLEKSRWTEDQEQVFRFALGTLNEFVLACADGGEPDSPFQLWLDSLEDEKYVPQEKQARVSVYPYRVTAGIQPGYHFVLTASQEGTRHVIRPYPFLTDQEETPETREIDLSDHYLRVYALSGREVRFSYARASFQGAQLPASFFLAAGRLEPAEPPEGDLYLLERQMWRGGAADAPPRLHPRQKEGFGRARRTGLAPKRVDLGRASLEDGELRRRIWERLTSADGLLALSPTLLEQYGGCPFQFLFQRSLGIEETQFTPLMWEAKEAGTLLHRVFQRFYRQLQGQPIRPERAEEYRRLVVQEARAVLEEYELDHPLPIAPVWEEQCRRVIELAEAFLEEELAEFPGQEILETEASLDLPLPGQQVRLTGKIDRISRVDGRVGLVDYKKRRLPRGAEIFGEEASSFQVPFYLYLLEKLGRNPEWAAYYSIEDRKYRFLFHPDRPKTDAGPEEVRQALAGLEERIRRTIEGIREGDFRPADRPEPAACLYCPLRGLCRSKFIPWE
jgi:RecB family exonuclease